MTWHWRYENANGGEVTDGVSPSDTFPSQADAESWLGESWRELLAAGVDAVTLLEGDRVEYESMSLRAE
ncbi:hypothetical protein FHS43_003193 [Streptosporangium becharense]|uniref:Uncharacterized protein n=1 Tax=Streptosporangium becharense TaxID=1816182 RepID=A0A7W9ID19_9ACTN|nr:hypothetical protein [Streptosporangium becharense]MBB2911913.1 hypothetical protein [Streptosporangium becharense]MBB5818460.1 hypothetical protein [Streptosporangium becharense]